MQHAPQPSPAPPTGAPAAAADSDGEGARPPIVVRPCASFADCTAVAALCGQEFWEECHGQGLSVQKWVEIEAEDLQNRPSWWPAIGARPWPCAGRLPCRPCRVHACPLCAAAGSCARGRGVARAAPPSPPPSPPPTDTPCRRRSRSPAHARRPGGGGRAPAGRGGADAGERGGRLHQLERVQPARGLRPHHPCARTHGGWGWVGTECVARATVASSRQASAAAAADKAADPSPRPSPAPRHSNHTTGPRPPLPCLPNSPCSTTACWTSRCRCGLGAERRALRCWPRACSTCGVLAQASPERCPPSDLPAL